MERVQIGAATLYRGDCIEVMRALPTASVHCCVTSPPYYGLRDYGVGGQIGLEASPEAYIARLVDVFREVKRVLRPDGTLWLNLGDSYFSTTKGSGGSDPETSPYQAGKGVENKQSFAPRRINAGNTFCKPKDLMMMPARVALALQADGWWLRSEIIWAKPNPMPESVRDRCTSAHEKIFLLSPNPTYYYDAEAIKEPVSGGASDASFGRKSRDERAKVRGCRASGNEAKNTGRIVQTDGTRNRRNVWTVASAPYRGAHFATFPPGADRAVHPRRHQRAWRLR